MNQMNANIIMPQLAQLPDVIEEISLKITHKIQDLTETRMFQVFYKSQLLFSFGVLLYICSVALSYTIEFDAITQFIVQMSIFTLLLLIINSGIIMTLDFISVYFNLNIDVQKLVKLVLGVK